MNLNMTLFSRILFLIISKESLFTDIAQKNCTLWLISSPKRRMKTNYGRKRQNHSWSDYFLSFIGASNIYWYYKNGYPYFFINIFHNVFILIILIIFCIIETVTVENNVDLLWDAWLLLRMQKYSFDPRFHCSEL